MKKMIVKNWKRIGAVALAVILVLGSIDLSGIVSNAAEYKPYYDSATGKYVYDSKDVLYAATHVHLFANTITSDAHTHGNVFCKVGDLGEYGTRGENNVLNNPIPMYDEVSYIQQSVGHINGASKINTLVIGEGIQTGTRDGKSLIYLSGGGEVKLDQTDKLFRDSNGVTAIDFEKEFQKLEARSRQFAETAETDNNSLKYDLTTDMNNRYINVNGLNTSQNVYLNIPYSSWKATDNKITIMGLDGNTSNTGIFVISIDMKDAPAKPDLGLNDMAVVTSAGSFRNTEYRTDQFGACRILFNLYDSSEEDWIYRGEVSFKNVFFGSILAPGAKVTVGAVNGTVVADEINHTGAESHRMDLCSLDTSEVTDSSFVNLELYKTFDGSTGGVDSSVLSATEFRLYTDPNCPDGKAIALAYPASDGTVTFQRVKNDLKDGDNIFYIQEYSTSMEYEVSTDVYKCTINKSGDTITTTYSIVGKPGSSTSPYTCDNAKRDTTQTGSTITLELIKTWEDFPSDETARAPFLDGTKFTLYTDIGCTQEFKTEGPKLVGSDAVVSFEIDSSDLNGKDTVTYYLKETLAPDGYVESNDVYACRITKQANDSYSVEYGTCQKSGDTITGPASYRKDFPKCMNYKEGSTPPPEPVNIGLNKAYEGLTLTDLGDATAIQGFLDGTEFTFTEVKSNGQAVAGAKTTTVKPAWDGTNAVVELEITIKANETKYYSISETQASDGYKASNDVCMWEIKCDSEGNVTAQYKVGSGSYMSYTEGSYPELKNTPVPYTGTISLIKTYDGANLSNATERNTLLNGTTFALYTSLDNVEIGTAKISGVHPVWEGGQAVVKFDLGSITLNLNESVSYYIKETAAPSGYVKSDVVYECRISNVNYSYKVEYRANTGDYTSAITCNNAKQTVNVAPVTVEINKTFDNPAGLSPTQMTRLIRDTKFTFYTDASAKTPAANGLFVRQTDPNSSGSVTYKYDYTGTLKPGGHYTYYVKETATNTNIYNMDTTVYKIDITVGDPTTSDAEETITPSVICTKVGGDGSSTGISFTNTRIPKAESPVTIEFTKVFADDFAIVTDAGGDIDGVISATYFTLYDVQGKAVTGLSQPTTSRGDGGNVTYTYTLDISSLDVGRTYNYSLKEANTNQKYYQLNKTAYSVQIAIDGNGKATVSYPNAGSSGKLEIVNKPIEDDPSEVLNSPEISFTKTFEAFNTFADGNVIIEKTTFTLTGGDAASIGFVPLMPVMNGDGATYSYRLDLPEGYTGGTYYIKESGTDSRYTKSGDGLEITIEVINGEAIVAFKDNNREIHNTLKPEEEANTPPTTNPPTPNTPTSPDTPSTPSTPTTPPSTPSTPNTWVTPDGKVHFEILIEYEHIDSSSKPERIEELITNTTIKIVDKDGNDVTENVTKITWDPSRDVAIVTVEVPKPSEGFDTYYVIESTDPADNDLSHSEPGKGFTVAVTSDAKVLFQEDGSATPTTELRFVNVEGATDTITNTMTSMSSPQTGERKLPWTVLGGGMSMIFIAGVVYVFKKKEKIEE